MSIHFQKRLVSSQHSSLKPIQKFPWNFYAVPERREVGNLQTAVRMNQLVSYKKIISFYKSYIESIKDQDYELLKSISEPNFFQEAKQQIQNAHKEHNEFEIENLRSFKKLDVFLFNVENFLLVGTDMPQTPLSLNRLTNLPRQEYIQSKEEELIVDLQPQFTSKNISERNQVEQVLLKVKTISQNTTKINFKEDDKIQFVSRFHFMIHSYINMFGINTESGEFIYGHPLPEKLAITAQTAHFMTLDRIVTELTVGDLQIKGTNQNKSQEQVTQATQTENPQKWKAKKNSFDPSFQISDFDYFMPNGNPILKID